MSKILILIGTLMISIVLAAGLVLMLPGHYHLDETKIKSSSGALDWTKSWDYPDQPLISLLGEHLGYSLLLQSFSFFIILFCSFAFSLFALRVPRLIPFIQKILAIGISAPSLFWIPLMVYFFSLKLEIFPLRFEPTILGWILPLLGLSLRPLFLSTEILLSEWKSVERQSYFLVARSKGLSRIRAFYNHGLKNALIPYVSQMGNFLVHSIVGSVLVESLFSFPGIGLLFVQSLRHRDLPVVLALTVLFSFIMILVHGAVEILQNVLEPRRKTAKG